MLALLRRYLKPRQIFFHEDDYCQQQILPAAQGGRAVAELEKIQDFSEAHRAKDGLGWDDIYVRNDAAPGLAALGITRKQLDTLLKGLLPSYDRVHAGYSSQRELCQNTGAWGTSEECCLFADWNEAEVIQNIWANFFARDERSLNRAADAVSALAAIAPLVYADWAWGFTCDASDRGRFIKLLRDKLEQIERRRVEFMKERDSRK